MHSEHTLGRWCSCSSDGQEAHSWPSTTGVRPTETFSLSVPWVYSPLSAAVPNQTTVGTAAFSRPIFSLLRRRTEACPVVAWSSTEVCWGQGRLSYEERKQGFKHRTASERDRIWWSPWLCSWNAEWIRHSGDSFKLADDYWGKTFRFKLIEIIGKMCYPIHNSFYLSVFHSLYGI